MYAWIEWVAVSVVADVEQDDGGGESKARRKRVFSHASRGPLQCEIAISGGIKVGFVTL